MPQDFRVESRSYDQTLRGSWQAYKIDDGMSLGNACCGQRRVGSALISPLQIPFGLAMADQEDASAHDRRSR